MRLPPPAGPLAGRGRPDVGVAEGRRAVAQRPRRRKRQLSRSQRRRPVLLHRIAPAGLVLIGAGGVLYTLGAFGYHRRWPNPAPNVFGFHEVFHTFVSAAVACHYLAIAIFVL